MSYYSTKLDPARTLMIGDRYIDLLVLQLTCTL